MLRDAGATESILILGDTADDMLDEAAKYDLDLTVFSMEGAENMAAAARRAGKKQNVQIKLNTGMNRIGFPVCQESFDTIKKICEMDDLNAVSYTHLNPSRLLHIRIYLYQSDIISIFSGISL